MTKSTPPFTVAEDADLCSAAQVIGIQRPKPIQESLTVPVLTNQAARNQSVRSTISKGRKFMYEVIAMRDRSSCYEDESSRHSISYDVENVCDDAELRVQPINFERTLKQFNSK